MKVLLYLCCVAVLLAGCAAPGVELLPSAAASAGAAASPIDIDSIVAQRQTATAVARRSPAAAVSAPPAATPTASGAPIAAPTPSPAADESTALPSIRLDSAPAADVGSGELVALGREGTVDLLRGGTWTLTGTATPGCWMPTAVVGDGSAWLGCGETLELTADGEWQDAGLPAATRLFRDRAGRVWALSPETVQVRENGAWTVYSAAETIGESRFPRAAMAFSPDGTVWLGGPSAANSLVSFDGQTWRAWGTRLKLERNSHPTALLATEAGDLLAGTDYGDVLRWEGENFTVLISADKMRRPLGAYSSAPQIRELAQTPDGTVWIATDLGLYSWQDGTLRVFDPAEGLPGREVNDIQVDDAGRLWAATGHGIAVREGEDWRVAEPATSGLSASFIVALAVEGAPEVPAPATEPQTATIVGRVTQRGEALGEHDVRLCSEQPTQSRRREAAGPCSNMSFYTTVKSGPDSAFRFADVPIGTYFLVARDRSNRWVDVSGAVVALEPGAEVRADIELP